LPVESAHIEKQEMNFFYYKIFFINL